MSITALHLLIRPTARLFASLLAFLDLWILAAHGLPGARQAIRLLVEGTAEHPGFVLGLEVLRLALLGLLAVLAGLLLARSRKAAWLGLLLLLPRLLFGALGEGQYLSLHCLRRPLLASWPGQISPLALLALFAGLEVLGAVLTFWVARPTRARPGDPPHRQPPEERSGEQRWA